MMVSGAKIMKTSSQCRRSRTGASSVPAWKRSATGPVTVVLVACGST